MYSSLLRISGLDWGSWAKQYLEPEEFCRKWNERFRYIHLFRELFGERFHIISYESAKSIHEELSEVTNKIFNQELDINLTVEKEVSMQIYKRLDGLVKELDAKTAEYIRESVIPDITKH